MSIRLNGSTSGYVEIDAPATAGSNTLVLPTGNGTNGQYLQTNGSGSLSWATVTPALFESYAIIADQKAAFTDAGTFSSGAWRTRDLNTEIADPDGIVSISSNQFTLTAGTYLIKWSCPAYNVYRHLSRLQDITNSVTRGYGTSMFAYSPDNGNNHSLGLARVSPTGSTVYQIQHHCTVTGPGNGFGVSSEIDTNHYTLVEIYKEV